MANFTTIADFNGTNGSGAEYGLVADSAGDLFTTTLSGGTKGDGTVVEIVETAGSYSATPKVLVTFNDTNGENPYSTLLIDSAGDLFGTTNYGTPKGAGDVFEIVKTAGVYASTPTDLANFNASTTGINIVGGLIADSAGDLFGTNQTNPASNVGGSVYELIKSGSTYAAPSVVARFSGAAGTGSEPSSGVIADAAGNLFGITAQGGATTSDGVLFEVVKTGNTYATTPTKLAGVNGTFGTNAYLPVGGLAIDAAGDLFGVAETGGAAGLGTVFELVKTAGVYASTPTVLVTFNGANGQAPQGTLLIDAAGDLFGTTSAGGASSAGTAFEIAKTGGSYASTPTVLYNFDGTGSDLNEPDGGLYADASGNLFGAANGGGDSNGDGGVYELTNTGYVACYGRGTLILTDRGEVAVEDLAIGSTVVTASGEHRPIRWIGRRSYAGRFLSANPGVQPVRFRAGSLGGGLPRRDLLVSPEHAMFLDGVLVPARCLTNATTITRERSLPRVDYFHVELETHDVLLAEGAASESFLDDDSRGMFHNAREFARLYPHAPAADGYCAPRVEQGHVLASIRAELASIAPTVGAVAA